MTEIQELVSKQKALFKAGKTMTHTFRNHQLQKLKDMLKRNESNIYDALKRDLNKSSYEVLMTELGFLYNEIDETMKYLRGWMTPEKVKSPTTHKGAKSYIYKQPYGVTLIISPWNYPLHLALAPLIGAIAGGNTAVIKPSEFTSHTSQLIEKMVKETFEAKYISVVQGEKEVSEALLDEPFDYIFFTGSTQVGKKVMEKASKQLIPVTLELGGKSPCIVDSDAKIQLAARRTAWGKLINAGQTCVAPDYLLVHENIKDQFVEAFKKEVELMYTENPIENDDYTKIINNQHFDRLLAYLDGENVIYGGQSDSSKEKINHTLIDNVDWDSAIMQEEIFGPLLPIMTFNNLDEVVDHVEHARNPLALYYFSENSQKQEWVIKNLSFGGACINDTIMHLGNNNLPFGGIGTSGIGSYHGIHSFEAFTHRKSVVKQTTSFDLSFRYPHSKIAEKVLTKVFKK
ncbi:aldehyde dehydrogenase [Alkalibacillus haloalkaliphilus]|uniref:aldehyde dehydrogenase n=1 Tax=Alkalibacillus haloalkaliphilus TaxID=94136 RepID=UPI002936B675|nr:aldehyde dehydrogenase [Alkalibacillus haloalkaliphilus]MDV2580896.1 aldehyde dehydrogenase [Alkalibacillus haloalkaliphilus]